MLELMKKLTKKARDRRDPSNPAPRWCWAFGVGKVRVGKPCHEDCRVKTNKKPGKLTKKEKRPLSSRSSWLPCGLLVSPREERGVDEWFEEPCGPVFRPAADLTRHVVGLRYRIETSTFAYGSNDRFADGSRENGRGCVARTIWTIVALLLFGIRNDVAASDHYRIFPDINTPDFHIHIRDRLVYDSDWPLEKRGAELTGIVFNNVTPTDGEMNAERFEEMNRSGNLACIMSENILQDKCGINDSIGVFLSSNGTINLHATNSKAYFERRSELRTTVMAPGQDLYTIPYFADGNYGRSSGSDRRGDIRVENSEIVHVFARQAFRTRVRILAQWHEEGSFDPDLGLKNRNDCERLSHENFVCPQ